ncbi:unnamed protein product [Mytilus edulis]|uniref:Uncharacterized protein n=1 Tax=Mytilus edulis TaxID=6550 RepID=A0A8S3UVG9_MYTED|nr:unnamed protein product [Mytilus edulis]
MENNWTVYRLKFINIAEKAKVAGYDYVPHYKTHIPKAPAFKRVQGYKVKQIVNRLSLRKPESANWPTTQHLLRRPESTASCRSPIQRRSDFTKTRCSNSPYISRRPVDTIGYMAPITKRPKSTNNLNNLLTSKRLDSDNGLNTHGSSIQSEKSIKGRKSASSNKKIRPASDDRLRTASHTFLRTASDARLRTAPDTSIRKSSDTRLRILTLNQPTVSSYIRFRMRANEDKKMDVKDIKDACDRHHKHDSIPFLPAKYKNWLAIEGIHV